MVSDTVAPQSASVAASETNYDSLPSFERHVRRHGVGTDCHLPHPLAEERVAEDHLVLAGRQAADLELPIIAGDGEERVVEHVDRRTHPRVHVAAYRELLGFREPHLPRLAGSGHPEVESRVP